MTRILITAAAGCILTGGIGYLLLPVLRALKAGQSIREIGPTWHNSKAGTPMMGGLMFIFGTILCLVGNFPAMSDDSPFYVLALALCFGLIGFLDDFTKVKFHRNLGLTTLQKAMLQMAVSALFLYAMYRSGFMDTHLYIPFVNVSFQLHPIVYIFFAMFVMVGTDNAVNLTDGVDGLCASISFYAYNLASLYKKNALSLTPLNCALNALILALNDSAAALVALLSKKFIIFR